MRSFNPIGVLRILAKSENGPHVWIADHLEKTSSSDSLDLLIGLCKELAHPLFATDGSWPRVILVRQTRSETHLQYFAVRKDGCICCVFEEGG